MTALAIWIRCFCATALLSGLLCSAEHAPPAKEHTETIQFPSGYEPIVSRIFEYKSNDIRVSGSVTFDRPTGQLQIQGEYTTAQNLDSGVSLAYQVFGEQKQLLWKEGERTPLSKSDEGSTANFDYSISLQGLDLDDDEDSLYVRFNYVKELEYWADQKFPQLELPALRFKGIRQKRAVSLFFSWIPHYAPRYQSVYSYHLFSLDRNLPNAASYAPSVQAYYPDTNAFDDNKRYRPEERRLGATRFLAARMKFESLGDAQARLGFVWEHVRWLEQSPKTYQSIRIVPHWAYTLAMFASLAIVHMLFIATFKFERRKARNVSFIIALAAALIFLLEFSSTLLPTVLLTYAAFLVASLCDRFEYRIYWIVTIFAITQEWIWLSTPPVPVVKPYGTLISLTLAALLAAPLVLITNRTVLTTVSFLSVPAISFIYISANLYRAFFDELPTWNILRYASQGLEVTDSIGKLLHEYHSVHGLILILFLALLMASRSNTNRQSVPKRPEA